MPRSKNKKRNPQGPASPPESIASNLIDKRRRGFLTGAVAGGMAAGAAALIRPDQANAKPEALDDRTPTYRETDHIRRAYERMRF